MKMLVGWTIGYPLHLAYLGLPLGSGVKRTSDFGGKSLKTSTKPKSDSVSSPMYQKGSNHHSWNVNIDIVNEDTDVIAINKPRVGGSSRCWQSIETLINGLVHKIEMAWVKMRPGIVHRIDKDTSGLLVVAKTLRAFDCLKVQFQDHSIERRYWAIAWGEVTAQTIEKPLGRHPTKRVRFAVVEDGKHAVTHIQPLGQGIPAQSGKGGLVSLVECRLETGRTHQIRVHMESIGHPLLGDPFYGRKGDPTSAWKPVVKGLTGQLLHAKTLGFQHPNGELMRFDSQIPSEFQTVLDFARVQIDMECM